MKRMPDSIQKFDKLSNKIFKGIDQVTLFINGQVHSAIVIFFLIAINYIYFHAVGNELQYFSLAKYYIDKDWIPNSFVLEEFPGTRLFYQYIVGTILKYVSFEIGAFILNCVFYGLLSVPLARLFKYFDFSNVEISIFFLALFFNKQSFFGGEFLIGGFESKTISYIFILFSLCFLLNQKYRKSLFFAVIGTYFHILVGLWFFVVWFFFFLFKTKNLKKALFNGVLFVVGVLPFIIYLFQEIGINTPKEIDGVNLDWIYTYYRAPHHTALFKSFDYFLRTDSYGMLLFLSFFVLNISVFRRSQNLTLQNLYRINVIIFILQFLFLVVAIFDRTGAILKYYPFRMCMLLTFLCYSQVMIFIKDLIYDKQKIHLINVVVLLTFLPFVIFTSLRWADKNSFYVLHGYNKGQENLLSFFEESKMRSNPDDIFLMLDLDRNYGMNLFFEKAERDAFVNYLIVPSGTAKLYEWYKRILLKSELEDDPAKLCELRGNYQIDFVISPRAINIETYQKVYSENGLFLYKVNCRE